MRTYYAVFSKLNKSPEALFAGLPWAKRFIKEQQKIWPNAKFRIEKINCINE